MNHSLSRASRTLALLGGLLALAACESTTRPDYAIRVTPTAKGGVATAPECPSYATESASAFDNQPMPQFGCATARNLAAMVETPNDLVHPRDLGPMRGVAAVGAQRRYDNNQTRGLIWTGVESNQVAVTTATTAASSITGDSAGAAAGGSSSSSSSSSSAATMP